MSLSLLQKETLSPSRRPSLTHEVSTSCKSVNLPADKSTWFIPPVTLHLRITVLRTYCTPGSVPRALTALRPGALPPSAAPTLLLLLPSLQGVPPLLQPSNPGLSGASSHGACPSRCPPSARGRPWGRGPHLTPKCAWLPALGQALAGYFPTTSSAPTNHLVTPKVTLGGLRGRASGKWTRLSCVLPTGILLPDL